jgi:hypothetical protein
MNDHELDQLIARANPYGDDTVRRLPAGAAEGGGCVNDLVIMTRPAWSWRATRCPRWASPVAM